jgi:hypothetical protein
MLPSTRFCSRDDEFVLIPLVYPEAHTAVSRRVTAYQPSPLGLHDFRDVSVK